jgi:serralysin
MPHQSQNPDRWCFTWLATRLDASGATRASLLKAAQWNPGDQITVSFLDGPSSLHQRVTDVGRLWTAPGLANLTLDFRQGTTDTDIRISFERSGSWSVLGSTCHQITDRAEPTMNFGWLNPRVDPDPPDDALRRVVLHEFGHALGLIHEHQNPFGRTIDWDRGAVIADLSAPPNRWDLATIEHNVFEPYERGEVNGTAFDPTSIMMYPIPARWTKDGTSVGLNTDLSAMDKALIREIYP